MAIKAKMAIASKNDFFVISFDFCVGSDTITYLFGYDNVSFWVRYRIFLGTVTCRSHTDLIHRLSFTPFSTNLATM